MSTISALRMPCSSIIPTSLPNGCCLPVWMKILLMQASSLSGETKNFITLEWTTENDMAQLAEYVQGESVEIVFFHGRIVSPAMVASLKQLVSIPVEIMDPFKKITLPKTLRDYREIENRRQEYASAVGLALRAE